eukprot:TRINITY_DN3842_c0_g1_i1.p1 TRINITY_DN3842_c0_g1~~TRINITY_DN3842_c0_g1_i1.p1  ORF type:complete len:2351 (-),score=511.23 TRINITY_DN3842_c0_g1_i1:62-7114(-)
MEGNVQKVDATTATASATTTNKSASNYIFQNLVEDAVIFKVPDPRASGVTDRPVSVLRIPVSFELLKLLGQFMSATSKTHHEETLLLITKLADDIVAKIVASLKEKSIDCGIDLASFLPLDPNDIVTAPEGTVLQINWRGVVLKLHQALLQAGPYEALLKRMGTLAALGSDATGLLSSASSRHEGSHQDSASDASSSGTSSPLSTSQSSNSSSLSSSSSLSAESSPSQITPPSFSIASPSLSKPPTTPTPSTNTIVIERSPVRKTVHRPEDESASANSALSSSLKGDGRSNAFPMAPSHLHSLPKRLPTMVTTTGFAPNQFNVATDPIMLPDGTEYIGPEVPRNRNMFSNEDDLQQGKAGVPISGSLASGTRPRAPSNASPQYRPNEISTPYGSAGHTSAAGVPSGSSFGSMGSNAPLYGSMGGRNNNNAALYGSMGGANPNSNAALYGSMGGANPYAGGATPYGSVPHGAGTTSNPGSYKGQSYLAGGLQGQHQVASQLQSVPGAFLSLRKGQMVVPPRPDATTSPVGTMPIVPNHDVLGQQRRRPSVDLYQQMQYPGMSSFGNASARDSAARPLPSDVDISVNPYTGSVNPRTGGFSNSLAVPNQGRRGSGEMAPYMMGRRNSGQTDPPNRNIAESSGLPPSRMMADGMMRGPAPPDSPYGSFGGVSGHNMNYFSNPASMATSPIPSYMMAYATSPVNPYLVSPLPGTFPAVPSIYHSGIPIVSREASPGIDDYSYETIPVEEPPPQLGATMPSSTSYRPAQSLLNASLLLASPATPAMSSPAPNKVIHALPSWLDFIIVLPSEDTSSKLPPGMSVQLHHVLLTLASGGQLDYSLECMLAHGLHHVIAARLRETRDDRLADTFRQWADARKLPLKPDPNIHNKTVHRFLAKHEQWRIRQWNDAKYTEQARVIVNLHRPIFEGSQPEGAAYAAVTASDAEEKKLMEVVDKIEDDIRLYIEYYHRTSLKNLERIAINLLGHHIDAARVRAVRLLNMMYDGHSWQRTGPFAPAIRCIGDAFRVSIDVELAENEAVVLKDIYLRVARPPPLTSKSSLPQVFSRYRVQVTSKDNTTQQVQGGKPGTTPAPKHRYTLAAEIPPFKRAGYYDWQLCILAASSALATTAHSLDSDFIPCEMITNIVPLAAGNEPTGTSGRFIVHPPVRDEIMHEVWVDLEDGVWDSHRGELVRIGSFASLTASLQSYAKDGISTLYVMGALAHSQNDHPFCPSDRSLPASYLGGKAGFRAVVEEAKRVGIRIVVDCTARLSSHGTHRKYRDQGLMMLDRHGTPRTVPGTDGVEFTWEECVLPNFRRSHNWNALIDEVAAWCAHGAGGVRLDSAHTWPLILRPDLDELYRVDEDGVPHYTLQEVMDGSIVHQWSNEGRTYGYWGTVPERATHMSPFYANPMFMKLTRRIWAVNPTFVFLAEVQMNRELTAIVSGLIPYSTALPRALHAVYEKELAKDGNIHHIGRQTVRWFYDYYEMQVATFPPNSLILNPSSTHHTPYPSQFFGAGTWAAIDLLYFLPEIPITYFGEQYGWMNHIDINSRRCRTGSRTPYDTQLPQIQGHYNHRAALRRTHEVFCKGGMMPLLCYHAYGWHDHVFAFARFTETELVLVAINFADAPVDFYVDCKPVTDICKALAGRAPRENSKEPMLDPASFGGIFCVTDFVNPANPPQYVTQVELVREKRFIHLPAYGSVCWNVASQPDSPANMRVLYEHSMNRLKRLFEVNGDPTHNHIYSLFTASQSSHIGLGKTLSEILTQLPLSSAEYDLPRFVQEVLFQLTRTETDRALEETRTLASLEVLAQSGPAPNNGNELAKGSKAAILASLNPRLAALCREILSKNALGSVVFVTPEFGRFSTVGGVGVMLDELSRSLVQLGVDVHVISPYYNFGKNGKTNYLEKEEGIKWTRNIVTFIGTERVEVGVHGGNDKGVNLHFLHHYDYFPTPYSTGSPEFQLKTIVLMAKASLELLCQLGHIPAVIVTNDWYTALVPAYARSGAFGNTFNGVTLFHLVHNLEEAYQGRIYPEGKDTLSYIHQLPNDLLVDPYWEGLCLNASRAALLTCNNWGTVSLSYLSDLRSSVLSSLLNSFPSPFAHSNGIRVTQRRQVLAGVATSHAEAKEMLQKKYFGWTDPNVPVLSFVGRIVLQKGVHLILNAVRELMSNYNGRMMVLVGGQANMKDPYAANCAWSMQALRKQFPTTFWADPDAFFSDGALVNYGSDFALMPSLFEPSGVVQQEYFAAGTPVVAFKTGGLKDTVFEYSNGEGNGFTFEAHRHYDFMQAVHRAMSVFFNPEQYSKLRQNSYNSVLDMSVVAEAWSREFSGMRRCIWADVEAVQVYKKKLLAEDTDEKEQPV